MHELDSPEKLFEQEQTVYQMILSRLQTSESLEPSHREAVAYRLAEIFVASRVLYTQVLPRFLEESTADGVLEVLGEVRMNLLNLKDLAEDFDEAFLASLSEADEEDPAEWRDEAPSED